MSNMPPDRKLFDNKEELNDKIEACLRIMDLPDELKEPKWYPIFWATLNYEYISYIQQSHRICGCKCAFKFNITIG